MTSVFVSAWVGAGNHGDELLFECLRTRLAALGAHALTVTSLDPRATRARHEVAAVHPRNIVGVGRAIRRADLFILGPGGLIQDTSSPWNLPYQLHRVFLAHAFRVPVVGVGLGADPLHRPLSGRLVYAALDRAVSIAVRDDGSRRSLSEHGVEATTTADLALGVASPTESVGDAIVVSLRPRRTPGLLPVRWQRDRLHADRVTAAATALDQVSTDLDAPVRFVAFEPPTDHPLHQAVAASMKRPATCIVPADDGLIGEVARARLVVATRYHAGVAALIAGRPAVLIGHAPKVRSLAAATSDVYPLLADTDTAFRQLASAARHALAADPAARRDARADLRAADSRNTDVLAAAIGAT